MSGRQLHELFQQHGGVAQIHTRPVHGGWANTYVAADGFTRTLNAREEKKWARYMEQKQQAAA